MSLATGMNNVILATFASGICVCKEIDLSEGQCSDN